MQSSCDHEQIIASIKLGQDYETPVIIKSESGEEIGRMVPITWDMANNRQIHENLARWRMQYMHFFLTYFEANANNTETFLKNIHFPIIDVYCLLCKIIEVKWLAISEFVI